MRIIRRPELMELVKKGDVIYSNIRDYNLEGLHIASYFSEVDFCTMNLLDELEINEWSERFDILDKALSDNNFHFELSMDYFGNEGLFDDNQQYVIYEREDVERLIKRLQEFI